MAETIIIGGGMTGLAAGIASGFPVYEASENPGGICRSFRSDGFHFEFGGGHWIFGVDNLVLQFLRRLSPLKRYKRKAAALIDGDLVPYPVQHHFGYTGPSQFVTNANTMKEWLSETFGDTACEMFFHGFNSLYTAGLYDKIAPQDTQKNPTTKSMGYNEFFYYPVCGLDELTNKMADMASMRYDKRLVAVDTAKKVAKFIDGEEVHYDSIISTIPLNAMMQMACVRPLEPCPHTSVIVINIGAEMGNKTPDSHWVYFPKSKSGFHRIGFYSNIDPMFAPEGHVAVYVEKAYRDGDAGHESDSYVDQAIEELQSLGYIGHVKVRHVGLVPVAYTWKWPGSTWIEDSLDWLAQRDIYSIGRYGKWKFQGIAESIRDGLLCGAALKQL